MKIAMIGHKDFPSRSGGVEVVVFELATRLAEKGHDVTVYNRGRVRGKNRFKYAGVNVVRCATSRIQSLNAFLYSVTATAKVIFKNYDIVHYHALGPSVMLRVAKLFGKKTVATVHGLDWQRAKWNKFASAYLMLGERIIAKYADEVIVLSDSVAKYFKEKYGRDCVVIRNAIVPILPANPLTIYTTMGLTRYGYILFLARIVPEKGLHHLIAAYKRLDTKKKLVIAGEMPKTEYGRQIKKAAEGCDKIVFTGFADGKIINELYYNCSLYVLPSEIEGMALTLLEAMSAGARCLTSDIPENTTVTKQFGRSFKTSDEDSLYEALCDALDEDDENEYAEEQKRYIMENFSYRSVIEETEKVYNSVLNSEK